MVTYRQAIISIQAFNEKGECVVIVDEKRPNGIQFPGGKFYGHGTLEDSARTTFLRETGLDVSDLQLHTVVCSTTSRTGTPITNYCFRGKADTSVRNQDRDATSGVYLILPNHSPTSPHITTLDERCALQSSQWSVTDNDYIWKRLRQNNVRQPPIPIIHVPESQTNPPLNKYSALDVCSALTVAQCKGVEGLILIEDANGVLGLPGGKAEDTYEVGKENYDPITAIMAEHDEEIALRIIPTALAGVQFCAKERETKDNKVLNGIATLTMVARPQNPYEVKRALDDTQKFLDEMLSPKERATTRDLIFMPLDEIASSLPSDLRSPGMYPVIMSYVESINERPSGEVVVSIAA